MIKLTKAQQIEQTEAIAKLRSIFPPGSTAKTILRRVSSSGMMRHISVISPDCEDVTHLVARALNWKRDDKTGGIKVPGAGMDMGFHLVYTMSRVIHTPSNNPNNGDWGYNVKHQWL